jgi:regulator of ribonuclease activity A
MERQAIMRTHVLHEQVFPCQGPIRVAIVAATADILDEHGDRADVCLIQFRSFGTAAFSGPVATIDCHEDNVLVRRRAGEPGEGRVLVVDAGGSMRCALVGDSIATLALDNGWSGIVLNGCVRDSHELDRVGLGIKARGTNPRPSRKDGVGAVDVPVSFGGVTFEPGALLYADDDGVVLLPS